MVRSRGVVGMVGVEEEEPKQWETENKERQNEERSYSK